MKEKQAKVQLICILSQHYIERFSQVGELDFKEAVLDGDPEVRMCRYYYGIGKSKYWKCSLWYKYRREKTYHVYMPTGVKEADDR